MTKAELLRTADSYELTEWQAYLTCLAEEDAAVPGRRKWNDED